MAKPHFNRLITALSLAVMWAVLLTGCGPQHGIEGELAPGQEPYLRFCASCHGNAGEGRPPAFPPLAGSEWMELPEEVLALIVIYGLRGEIEVAGQTYRGYMPPMQHINDEQLAALIGFTVRAWGDREPDLAPEDVAALRQRFGRRSPLEGREGVEAIMAELES